MQPPSWASRPPVQARAALSHSRTTAVARRFNASLAVLLALTLFAGGCHRRVRRHPATSAASTVTPRIEPFRFQISANSDRFQIDGFIAIGPQPGRLPAMLVLNGAGGDAHKCIRDIEHFTALGMRLACISMPGFGKSSGPNRFVGPPAVDAARHALDLLAARPDVDPARLAVWGVADGAVAAGLLMDSDSRMRAVILQSGAYDLLKYWPEAPLGAKLSILRRVWPSKRALKERSVVEHLPRQLACAILILHGEQDRKMPIEQAEQLARALSERGANVETYYFPKGSHNLGTRVDVPVGGFLREHLLSQSTATPAASGPPGSSN
jgi:pimeloyl-ACP methyl ester carboxylesterase